MSRSRILVLAALAAAGGALLTLGPGGPAVSWALAALVLLGVLALLAPGVAAALRARRAYAGWRRPRRFDRNLVVIGAGAAGLVAAYLAAALRARVTLVERDRMGGDCLNTGCVPSKALLRAARLAADMRRAGDFGLGEVPVAVDFPAVMERVRKVVQAIEPHDSEARYRSLGVEVLRGTARLVSPWEVAVTGADGGEARLTTRSMVIAAGARPAVPDIPGLAEAGYLTSETLWDLQELPARLLVLGGGPVGCEMAQAFARLGSRVALVEAAPRLLGREDPEVSELVTARLRAEGIDVRGGHLAREVRSGPEGTVLVAEHAGAAAEIPCDAILVAVGRSANLEGYGLEDLGIPAGRTLEVNEFLQTRYPNIYAAGDVAGPFQLTHAGAHQAWYATVNALFAPFKRFRADYSVLPAAVYVDPEVARVGLNEQSAREQGVAYEVTRYDLADLDRAITDGVAEGFVKVLTPPGRDRILGATIVGEHAGDLLAELALAMRHGLGLDKVLGTVHSYPTLAEASKYAAGAWRRAHAPEGLLRWLARFHRWRRGTP